MAIRAKTMSWQTLALLVAALAVWGWQQWDARGGGAEATVEVLEGCRWEDHRHNDGDSFRLRLADGRVEEFRLYFVDAPESAFKSYGGGRDNHQRIAEQAAVFGVDPERAVEVGAEAKRRVRERLAGESLRMHTGWDDPFGDRRFHAFVELPGGGWLHEWLVEEGLARIHTKGAALPDGTSRREQERRLRRREEEARAAGRGGWGREG